MIDVPVERFQVIPNSLIMEFISLGLLLQIKNKITIIESWYNLYLCGRPNSSNESYIFIRYWFLY